MVSKVRTRHRKKIIALLICIVCFMLLLIGRLIYVMVFCSEYYIELADELHQRERSIKAARGRILDTNGVVLADNKTVCTISVIHSQITEPQKVISVLSEELGISKDDVRKRVEKNSAIERVKTNVAKETGDRIREYGLSGVKVDEDYKRYYPFGSLASKVIGFTGSDNQGILGIESKYDSVLAGDVGKILTMTDAWGIELDGSKETRLEALAGSDLYVSIDYNIQSYAQQLAEKTLTQKNAKSVSIIAMNPQNGEIMAMVNVPEYDLNSPYQLPEGTVYTKKTDALNNMWRNFCINDTYEPGSVYKIFTATAALEEGVVTTDNMFSCCGYALVADRRIRCHKTTGHGTQTFAQTLMNSCNPAFVEWGRRLGTDNFYRYMEHFGILNKTGIDLPGEASTIVHKKENVKEVELATMSFGQSFQITAIQMLRFASAVVNGGNLVTPHFAVKSADKNTGVVTEYNYETDNGVISEEVSTLMKNMLRQVVEEGGGKKAYIEGFSIGGKTATSEKLPRSANKYIASFIGFSPADNPKIIAMCIIDEPEGVYYGGTIAAPVIRELYENILPYLEISGE